MKSFKNVFFEYAGQIQLWMQLRKLSGTTYFIQSLETAFC